MHHLEYHPKSPEILQIAKAKYPYLTQEWLSDESIEARYYLLEYLATAYGYHAPLEKDEEGKPIELRMKNREWRTVLFWSITHTENYLAFIISDTPTGIDIAEVIERDISLFSTHSKREYALLGGKSWKDFYILWTAKEAILKSVWGKLDDMREIELIDSPGENRSEFALGSKKYRIQSIIDAQCIVSYLLS